ncbi:MAG: solute carrier family 26 protein [Lewinellaceae bacterium]|nr:solute carrier family 26 protein [Phaeodactylibacter sp.]MCB0612190.1 solute carrier family 26 protein [Phaeodactylibacter sp.]MCB9350127.1 solute carrier family 26 protein [Lewinellaceae bacterium]
MKDIRTYIPILDWLPKYKKSYLRGDLLAGLTVGVMLVPQGMAYGLLAGLTPVYGLYASIVPLFFYAFFGTSRQLSVGPTALVSLLVLAGVSQFAETGTEAFITMAIATALIAGVIQILLGVFRLGFLINFLSHPVIAGFTSAAAFIIGLSQLKNLLRINISRSNFIHEVLIDAFRNIGDIHWPTVALGLGGIAFILLLKRINKSLPGALLVVILSTAAVYLFGMQDIGVEIVKDVPNGLPPVSVPHIDWPMVKQLLPLALTICLISFIESLAIARTIEAMHKDYRVVPNQELIALGVTKIGGAFFHSYPTTGSFTRSAVNNDAGAQTGVSSMVSAVLIALTILFLTPLFFYLPKAILGSIIVVAVINLVDYREAIHLWRTDRTDFMTMIVTFVATLTLGIQNGVFTGVILSLALMIYRNSKPNISILGQLPNSNKYRNINRFEKAVRHNQILIVRFDAQLYFGNATYFRESLEAMVEKEGKELKLLILDASSIHDIDSSGIKLLLELMAFLQQRDVQFYLSGAIGPVRDILKKNGLIEKIGTKNHFMYIHDAVDAFHKRQKPDEEDSWSPDAVQTNDEE